MGSALTRPCFQKNKIYDANKIYKSPFFVCLREKNASEVRLENPVAAGDLRVQLAVARFSLFGMSGARLNTVPDSILFCCIRRRVEIQAFKFDILAVMSSTRERMK